MGVMLGVGGVGDVLFLGLEGLGREVLGLGLHWGGLLELILCLFMFNLYEVKCYVIM